eukprot:763107-Hanusia_phi.AAC.1
MRFCLVLLQILSIAVSPTSAFLTSCPLTTSAGPSPACKFAIKTCASSATRRCLRRSVHASKSQALVSVRRSLLERFHEKLPELISGDPESLGSLSYLKLVGKEAKLQDGGVLSEYASDEELRKLLPPSWKRLIDASVEMAEAAVGGSDLVVSSMYVVGAAGRGSAIEGVSKMKVRVLLEDAQKKSHAQGETGPQTSSSSSSSSSLFRVQAIFDEGASKLHEMFQDATSAVEIHGHVLEQMDERSERRLQVGFQTLLRDLTTSSFIVKGDDIRSKLPQTKLGYHETSRATSLHIKLKSSYPHARVLDRNVQRWYTQAQEVLSSALKASVEVALKKQARGEQIVPCQGWQGGYSQDLLPSYHAATCLFPPHKDDLFLSLQLSCLPWSKISHLPLEDLKFMVEKMMVVGDRLVGLIEDEFVSSFEPLEDLSEQFRVNAVRVKRKEIDPEKRAGGAGGAGPGAAFSAPLSSLRKGISSFFSFRSSNSDEVILVEDELPATIFKQGNPVDAFDMRDPAQAEEAKRLLRACSQPVLLKNACQHWQALKTWSKRRVEEEVSSGIVRVAPSANILQCNSNSQLISDGSFVPPSRMAFMSGQEFGRRIREDRGHLPPLFYDEEERVYLQTEAPDSMLAEAPIPSYWEELGVEAGGCTNFWVSTKGIVSPLHYDATHSFLAQVEEMNVNGPSTLYSPPLPSPLPSSPLLSPPIVLLIVSLRSEAPRECYSGKRTSSMISTRIL